LFLNDAQAFLLGEITALDISSQRVAGFTLGTGIGSAFCDNGHILEDDPRVPPRGKIWNMEWAGGTVEDFLSTRTVSEAYRNATGERLSVKDIASRARTDTTASRVLSDFGHNLGSIVEAFCADFDPHYVVLGGGIARFAPLFLPAMQRAFTRMTAHIRLSTLLENAALLPGMAGAKEQRPRGLSARSLMQS
jgi:glucokinase